MYEPDRCPLCLDGIDLLRDFILGCGHRFCLECCGLYHHVTVRHERDLICPICRAPWTRDESELLKLRSCFMDPSKIDSFFSAQQMRPTRRPNPQPCPPAVALLCCPRVIAVVRGEGTPPSFHSCKHDRRMHFAPVKRNGVWELQWQCYGCGRVSEYVSMNSIPPRWCRLHSTVVVLDFTLGRAYRACGICDGSDVPTLLVCDEVPTLPVCVGEALPH